MSKRITDDIWERMQKANPDRFPKNTVVVGYQLPRCQVWVVELYVASPTGGYDRYGNEIYFFYQNILLASFIRNDQTMTWYNVEKIPNHGLSNSVRKILETSRVYSRVSVSYTGTYRVLKRADGEDVPRYLYSGAKMTFENGDFKLLTEEFKPYFRPDAGEKESSW